MMLYQEGRGFDPGAVRTELHPDGSFAEIRLGDTQASLFLRTPEEADALIRAAIAAKDLLLAVPAGECHLCGSGPGSHRVGCPALHVTEARAPMLTAKGEAAYPEANADGWCAATTEHDGETLYCDREAGHPGSHQAPGPDEGSEVAWSDELPADTACPDCLGPRADGPYCTSAGCPSCPAAVRA